jgi:hypothetical protein
MENKEAQEKLAIQNKQENQSGTSLIRSDPRRYCGSRQNGLEFQKMLQGERENCLNWKRNCIKES